MEEHSRNILTFGNERDRNIQLLPYHHMSGQQRMRSNKTNRRHQPLINLYPNSTNRSLTLKFIRTHEDYRLKNLLNSLYEYAKRKNYNVIKLENNAVFTNTRNTSCTYSAKIYRVFQNKPSLYESQLYFPNMSNRENLNRYKNYIYNYPLSIARNDLPIIATHFGILGRNIPSFTALFESLGSSNLPDIRFGTFLLSLQETNCRLMNEIFVRLDYLSAQIDTILHNYFKTKLSQPTGQKIIEYIINHENIDEIKGILALLIHKNGTPNQIKIENFLRLQNETIQFMISFRLYNYILSQKYLYRRIER